MPVRNKFQLLADIENTEGVAVALAADDALLVFNPELSDSYQITDRRPAGPSLSRDLEPVGRQTRTLTFTSDFRGSADVGVVAPWSKLIRACAFDEVAKTKLTIAGMAGGTGRLQPGEIVQVDADNYGIVLAELMDTDKLHVAWIQGTAPTSGTVTGQSTGTVGTVSAGTTEGKYYVPTSLKAQQVSIDSWSGSQPSAGDVLKITRAGAIVGAGQIYAFTSGGTDFKFLLHWGTIANGDTLTAPNASTAAVDQAVTQVHTPSLTIQGNLDGFQRQLWGSRGDFTLTGESGAPMQFAWTFNGQVGGHVDALPVGGVVISTAAIPRLVGATVGIADGAHLLKLPTKRVELAMGNQVSMRADANQPGGDIGSVITDRDPTITVEVDLIGKSSIDLIGILQASTTVRFAVLFGSGAGNRMAIVAPRCQITGAADGDAEGIATFTLTLKPRRVRTSGDDELYLAQI